jgi:hypothetical protein
VDEVSSCHRPEEKSWKGLVVGGRRQSPAEIPYRDFELPKYSLRFPRNGSAIRLNSTSLTILSVPGRIIDAHRSPLSTLLIHPHRPPYFKNHS